MRTDENVPTRPAMLADGQYRQNSIMGDSPRERTINIALVTGAVLALLLLVVISVIGINIHQDLDRQTSIQAAQAKQAKKAAALATAHAVDAYPAYLPGNGKLYISDTLQQSNSWQQNEDRDFGGSCQFQDGAMYARQVKPGRFYGCTSFLSSFMNFAFEVQMSITRGDCGVIAFRANDVNNQLYYVEICQDGTYQFKKYLSDPKKHAFQFASNSHAAIKKGLNQVNLLTIYANKDILRVFVNGQQIAVARDGDYTKGSITLNASDYTNATEVVFKQAKVWTFS